MKIIKIFSLLLILSFTLSSCEKILEPLNDNHSTFDRIKADADFAEGLLITPYALIPTNLLSFNDVATDDAVSNIKLDQYRLMSTGQWSAIYNPLNQWDNSNLAIMYLNNFLSIVDDVNWKWTNTEVRDLFAQRFKGEAYALRGLFKYHLLVTIGGEGSNGEMLGIPVYNNFVETQDQFNTPRASYAESIASIYDDFDKALTYLTIDDYRNIANLGALPAGFEWITNVSNYNTVFGNSSIQRISGRIVKALKARVALLAASPAFNTPVDVTLWQDAANYAANVLTSNGGVAGLDPNGHKWYVSTYVDNIKLTTTGLDQKEMIWRTPRRVSNSREAANFPPSLFGQGNINPTQNLVDVFPMINGYPINHPSGLFDPTHPYVNRDPRFALYIASNGSSMKGTTIKTGISGGVNAKDSISTSTRTGYYMRKLLREDVSMDPNALSTKNHYEVHMRYTELFLIYAEAANEAWGTDGTGANTFSARDVIAAIRKRAGITQPDNYLASITTQDDMRALIRNERRIELCFEGFRFWDLRRWNLDLTEPAKGVDINYTGTSFNLLNIEERVYDNDYMRFGPLPMNEILKFGALIQNKGW